MVNYYIKLYDIDPAKMEMLAEDAENQVTGAVDDASRAAWMTAKFKTPVYQPHLYPSWSMMPHHHTAPGRLKASIEKLKTRRLSHRQLRGGLISRVPYATYQESGFWHTKAKRWIHGNFFMKTGGKVYRNTAGKRLKIRLKTLWGKK